MITLYFTTLHNHISFLLYKVKGLKLLIFIILCTLLSLQIIIVHVYPFFIATIVKKIAVNFDSYIHLRNYKINGNL